jgi:hypothetical protein
MNFYLDEKSLSILQHVNPHLKQACIKAINVTPKPFQIHEGLRSEKTQAEMLTLGLATTMKNKHLTGDAVDIYCMREDKISYNYDDYQIIANAFDIVMTDTDHKINWRGYEGKDFAHMIHFEIEGNT